MTTPYHGSPPSPPVVNVPAPSHSRRGILAVMSEVVRDGDWIVPRHFRTLAFWASVELDLTRARLEPGTTEIEIKCIMANVTITVPPHIHVDCVGDPVMGSFAVRRKADTTAGPDAPFVRVSGTAFMGTVEVIVKDPNAPSAFERIRRKLSAKGG